MTGLWARLLGVGGRFCFCVSTLLPIRLPCLATHSLPFSPTTLPSFSSVPILTFQILGHLSRLGRSQRPLGGWRLWLAGTMADISEALTLPESCSLGPSTSLTLTPWGLGQSSPACRRKLGFLFLKSTVGVSEIRKGHSPGSAVPLGLPPNYGAF